MNSVKRLIKLCLPRKLYQYRQKHTFKGLNTKQIFEKIYAENLWGNSQDLEDHFYSGPGSHDPNIVSQYIESVRTFLASLPHKPNVADLGCGDFAVGSKIRPLCDAYIACDVVAPLIERNKKRFSEFGVDFRTLNIAEDELPEAEIIFIREVFQHLSNQDIQHAVSQLPNKCQYLVLTECLPRHISYQSNIDISSGTSTRANIKSGITLTEPPFNMQALEEKVLYEVPVDKNTIIKTILYRFN